MEISLDELENEVKSCRNCNLCQNRTNTVFGCGNKNAKIMFIGKDQEQMKIGKVYRL